MTRNALAGDAKATRVTSLRLLKLAIAGALVLPVTLFAFASWVSYRHISTLADERLARSLDVLHEQANKVFRSIDGTLDTVEEMVAGLTNSQIDADAERIHARLARISRAFEEVQSVWIFDEAGRALATSLASKPPSNDFSGRDYIRNQLRSPEPRFIGQVNLSPFGGRPFFAVSRARRAPDKSFSGVLEVSVVPDDFHRFYRELENSGGLQYALIRADGTMLARYPVIEGQPAHLDSDSGFAKSVASNPNGGRYTTVSKVDAVERRFSVRKVAGFPLYVSAGIETAAIRAEWLSAMGAHLFFGVPATLLLASSLYYILRRTQRLHEEEDRREAAEHALHQTQKMESIGQLTGGVAHDFNNLLTIIIGNLERAGRLAGDGEERLQRSIANAMTGARRAATLTQRLLAFSRRAPHKVERIDPNRLLANFSEFLTRTLGERISLECVGSGGVWPCEADRSALEAALLNLAVNARDAMPAGGKLTIETANAYLDETYCRQHEEVSPGQYVVISVTDTGTGMTPDVAQRAIEPFFTTKPPGQGTGLGLSQVYGFAKQSGGHFKIYTEVGQGTTMKMYLPRATMQGAEAGEQASEHVARGSGQSILVVEDDAAVRQYVVESLRDLDYRVRHAASAEDAMKAGNDQPFDLLLTDVVLPGRNGRLLAEEMTRAQPSLKVIYMTGYSRNAIVHQGRLDSGLEMLEKPLTSSDLARVVGRVLRNCA